jgi:hypothetical protein
MVSVPDADEFKPIAVAPAAEASADFPMAIVLSALAVVSSPNAKDWSPDALAPSPIAVAS